MGRIYLRIVASLLFFITFCSYASSKQSTVQGRIVYRAQRIGVINLEDVFSRSLISIDMKNKLSVLEKDLRQKLKNKEDQLSKEEKVLLSKRSSSRRKDITKRMSELKKSVAEHRQYVEQEKSKLNHVAFKMSQHIYGEIIRIVHQISKEKRFMLVLPLSHVLFADHSVFITDEVIQALDQSCPTVDINQFINGNK
ncbi:OmpH/Skp family outer membrane protein [Candidatus Sneabacter namystus]|uniref:OmpH family outer membrane protein n=1 Tax=Candidatus Sneabacter namystus TaxID=2601646 RepID=A0A5C0UIU3_9RICK|nr:OmpH family outer membrane protein [Candidatus Sneabacter namystus]QEK39670.1 OmpH family outer membrane protein [Candidatus Sneabacter namystus]